uniref:Uncharacterized protein n=1 Tax=Anguilla anguilla TaxID=7936 RepID=A0A0E9WXG5_ANGAN
MPQVINITNLLKTCQHTQNIKLFSISYNAICNFIYSIKNTLQCTSVNYSKF